MVSKVMPDTGEVVVIPVFASAYVNPYEIKQQDLSNEFEDIFEEIAPYAVDPNTGEFLNNSSVPKIVKTGRINIQEKIQSYAKDCDIYAILEKFAYSEDPSFINKYNASYGDISSMPDNLNDFAQMVNLQVDKLASINPELAKMILDENVSASDIEAKAKEIMNSRIDEINKNNIDSNNGKNESEGK